MPNLLSLAVYEEYTYSLYISALSDKLGERKQMC